MPAGWPAVVTQQSTSWLVGLSLLAPGWGEEYTTSSATPSLSTAQIRLYVRLRHYADFIRTTVEVGAPIVVSAAFAFRDVLQKTSGERLSNVVLCFAVPPAGISALQLLDRVPSDTERLRRVRQRDGRRRRRSGRQLQLLHPVPDLPPVGGKRARRLAGGCGADRPGACAREHGSGDRWDHGVQRGRLLPAPVCRLPLPAVSAKGAAAQEDGGRPYGLGQRYHPP